MPESPEQLNVKKSPEAVTVNPEDLKTQPETSEDLEKLVQEKIKSAEGELEGLGESGKIEACNNTVNLPPDKVAEIKETTAVVEKLETINEKKRSLLEEMKVKMKTAVAIGMATVAFSGAGGIKEAQAGVGLKTTKTIESVETSEQKASKTKREKELLKKYEQAKKEVEDTARKNAMENDPKYRVEKIKDELMEHISSQGYLNKLKSEFGGNENRAKNEQARRIENLKKVKINIASLDAVNEEFKKRLKGQAIPGGFKGCDGFYDSSSHETFISLKDYFEGLTSFHELLHASTLSDRGITYKAKNALKNSYENQGYLGRWIKDEKDKYFSKPTERLVRKQALDRELEVYGIKKYGEEFTEEHYKKMMEAYEKGMFSSDANDFIKRTKKDPKIFMQIFNEIAKNEEEKENPSSSV